MKFEIMKNNLSVTIITLNEEKNIEICLKSLKNLDAEVIIVDSGSVDRTLEIAKKYKAKIYYRKFDNFANQKNWAVSRTSKDWILSVDADEIIPEELVKEILEVIQNGKYAGFLIPRRNFILGAEIKHSRWSPDKHIWLWKKSEGHWEGEVHEEVVVKGKVGELKNKKIHHQQDSVSDFLMSNDVYSSILSRKKFKEGIKFSIWMLFWDPVFEFSLRFIYKLGFLDGWRGFILAYLMAIYKVTFWVKIWELERDK